MPLVDPRIAWAGCLCLRREGNGDTLVRWHDLIKFVPLLIFKISFFSTGKAPKAGWPFGHDRKFGLCISVYFEFGPLEIKTENYLSILLPDKFGYPIIRVRFRSWPNFVIVVVNTKLGEYLVKVLGQQFRSNLIFFQCMYSYQFARTNINSGII
jgi:hypothetical protein